jgi:hypothetical protein
MFKTLDEARLAMIEQRLERYRQCRLNSPTSHTNEQLVKHHAMRLAEDDVPWLIDRVRALNNQSIDDAEIGDALANVLGNFRQVRITGAAAQCREGGSGVGGQVERKDAMPVKWVSE